MAATVHVFPQERIFREGVPVPTIEKPVFRLTDILAGFRAQDPGVLTLFRRAYEERSRIPELPENDQKDGMVRLLAVLLRQPIPATEAPLPEAFADRSEGTFDLFAQPFWSDLRIALETLFVKQATVFQTLERNMVNLGVEYLPTHLETLLMWYYDNKSAHPFEGGR